MKRVRGNEMDFSTIDITSKEVRGNNIDFSAIIEITSKIVRESNEDFLTREIVSAKVSGNNVDIFIRQNMSKKNASKPRELFDHWNYMDKAPGNDAEIRRNLFFDVST